jgi:hypothetical protein
MKNNGRQYKDGRPERKCHPHSQSSRNNPTSTRLGQAWTKRSGGLDSETWYRRQMWHAACQGVSQAHSTQSRRLHEGGTKHRHVIETMPPSPCEMSLIFLPRLHPRSSVLRPPSSVLRPPSSILDPAGPARSFKPRLQWSKLAVCGRMWLLRAKLTTCGSRSPRPHRPWALAATPTEHQELPR